MGGFSTISGNGLGSVMNADNVSFDGTIQGGVITTNGQLLIGSTATPHIRVGTLGSSDGSITWTVGSGTITGQVTGGTTTGKTITGDTGGALSPVGGNWNILGGPGVTTSGSGATLTINSVVFNDTSGTQTLSSDNGYFATAASTFTLPASPAQGELVIVCADTTGSVVVTANTGQVIRVNNDVSSTAGTATNSARGDVLELRYRSTGAVWFATSTIGLWTLA